MKMNSQQGKSFLPVPKNFIFLKRIIIFCSIFISDLKNGILKNKILPKTISHYG